MITTQAPLSTLTQWHTELTLLLKISHNFLIITGLSQPRTMLMIGSLSLMEENTNLLTESSACPQNSKLRCQLPASLVVKRFRDKKLNILQSLPFQKLFASYHAISYHWNTQWLSPPLLLSIPTPSTLVRSFLFLPPQRPPLLPLLLHL